MDGCDDGCVFENPTGLPSGPLWVCENMQSITTCCRSRLNPVTLQYVCNCITQPPLDDGYIIKNDCSVSDVNECYNSPCIPLAVCENLDGTLRNGKFKCTCPPGMFGDGQKRCGSYMPQTNFLLSFSLQNVNCNINMNNKSDIIRMLFSFNVLPSYVRFDDVEID